MASKFEQYKAQTGANDLFRVTCVGCGIKYYLGDDHMERYSDGWRCETCRPADCHCRDTIPFGHYDTCPELERFVAQEQD